MDHPWGLDYSEAGLVSRQNLYVVDNGNAVKCSPDAPVLAICIPSRGTMPVETFMGLRRLSTPINTHCIYMYTSGLMGTSGRDKMTKECIRLGVEFIYFADDDVLPPPDTLYKMLRHMQMDSTIGLITGVYTTKTEPISPHIYKEPGKGTYWDFSLSPYDPPEDIWGCGAGCMMVRVDSIKKMSEPYWAESAAYRPGQGMAVLGHDLNFCQQVRDTGYRVVVDGSIQCDHYSTDTKKMYRLPKNSPPVQRFKNDPRNSEYWMNWWRVNPGGEGSTYASVLQVLDRLFNADLESHYGLVNTGGGAIAQAAFNISRGRVAIIPVNDEEKTYANNLLLPQVTVEAITNKTIVFEPESLLHEVVVQSYMELQEDVIVITRRKYDYPYWYKEGDWNVYSTEELSGFTDRVDRDSGMRKLSDCPGVPARN